MHQAIARGKLHTQGGAVGEDVKVEGERKEETYLLLAALALLSVVLLVGAMVLDHLNGISAQEYLFVVQLLGQGVTEVVGADLRKEGREGGREGGGECLLDMLGHAGGGRQ